MAEKYINLKTIMESPMRRFVRIHTGETEPEDWVISGADIMKIPGADVVSLEEYNHLLKVAKAMHTWIFLNTSDEQKAYDECHLTDEDNAMLGYGGQFIITEEGGEDDV